ncbi:MAG: amino acid racemase [bacterium]|nr:amino acid racemase [bacterium]
MKKTIGILGGMGPEATVHTFNLLVQYTKADTDQEHIPIIVVNNPQIPNRTDAIIGNGESPLPVLKRIAQTLQRSGADFIIMPCHTSHYFYNDIVKDIDIPFLHLQEETLNFVRETYGGLEKFGLLATTGTVKAKLFPSFFERNNLKVVEPTPDDQESVMEAIFGIKRGLKDEPYQLFLGVIENLKKQGAQAIIAGCTEVSLVLGDEELNLPVIDPLLVITQAAIKRAGGEVKAFA